MKVIVNKLAVEYADEGNGPVMLFLHGWNTDLHTFDALTAELSRDFRIARLDLPGFGGSELPKESWGVGEYSIFVKDFCEKLDITPVALLGHSFGGRIAIKAVARGIFTPEKLILLGSAGVARRTVARVITTSIVAFKNFARFIPSSNFFYAKGRFFLRRLGGFYQQRESDYHAAGALKSTFLKVIAEDLSPEAKKISIPTLLIWGEDDTATPLSEGKRLRELIIGSTLKVIAGASHFVHQEKPSQVSTLVREFLRCL